MQDQAAGLAPAEPPWPERSAQDPKLKVFLQRQRREEAGPLTGGEQKPRARGFPHQGDAGRSLHDRRRGVDGAATKAETVTLARIGTRGGSEAG